MNDSFKHFGAASLSALGINGLAVGVGDNELWWLNLIGTLIATLVAAIVAKKKTPKV